jgi:molybdate transport system substrate-binding protein
MAPSRPATKKFPSQGDEMNRSLALISLIALFLAGCTPAAGTTTAPTAASGTRTLHVFAAASLTDAFTEIGMDFENANPGTTIAFNFAGSQALRTQIEEGAPADIFASANQAEMEALIADSLIDQNASKQFLDNQLVVILPGNNPAGLEKLEDLAKPGIKLVLAAEEVPVGKYARQALDTMNIRSRLQGQGACQCRIERG